MNNVIINDQKIELECIDCVNITKKELRIAGELIPIPESPEINIYITGNVQDLTVDSCEHIIISGNVRNVKTSSGDVLVKGDVLNFVTTNSGDVRASSIEGGVVTNSGGTYLD